jgi:hypothetical protein
VLNKEAHFKLLTSFVHSMKVDRGKYFRYRIPSSTEEAFNIPTVVYNVSKLESRHRERQLFTTKEEVSELARRMRRSATKRPDKWWQTQRENKSTGSNDVCRSKVRNPVVFRLQTPWPYRKILLNDGQKYPQRRQEFPKPIDDGISQPKSTTNHVYSIARNRKGERGFSSDSRNPSLV